MSTHSQFTVKWPEKKRAVLTVDAEQQPCRVKVVGWFSWQLCGSSVCVFHELIPLAYDFYEFIFAL